MLAASAIGFTACDDDPELPPMIVPEATIEANTSILELKEKFWNSDASVYNYIDTIGTLADGQHMIIKGRVVGNDISGNISKYLTIQDETAAISFSIDAYDLYKQYHIGQEVVVDMTDLYIGKYNRQYLVGYPGFYAAQNVWQAGRMTLELLQEHAQVNGLIDMATVDTATVTIPQVKAIAPSNSADMVKWGHRLVKFENVTFQDGGKETFAPYHENNVVRNIVDANGNIFPTVNSGYADFYDKAVPTGTGTVTGILSYVGRDGWRLTIREYSDVIGFDNNTIIEKPEIPSDGGTLEKPFTIAEVIAMAPSSKDTPAEGQGNVWIEGFIVGWADLGTGHTVINAETAKFDAAATLATNLLVAASADETDVTKCIGVQLPNNDVRPALNLKDNPDNYKKPVKLRGDILMYSGVTGLKNTSAYELDGVQGPTEPEQPEQPEQPEGDLIYAGLSEDATSIDWTFDNVIVPDGINEIWAWKNYKDKYYLNGSAFSSTLADSEAYAISPVIDLTGKTSASVAFDHAAKFQTTIKELCGLVVREAGSSEWTSLEIATWPPLDNKWTWANSGAINLSAFAGKKIEIAFKYGSSTAGADTWEVKNVKVIGK